jgi:hypothetical protein
MPQDYNDHFPIKTATACNSKWAWSTIWLNKGQTSSCHRVDSVPLDPDNFANFHNLPKKISDRELMLKGEWPTGGCEYCQKIEVAGGHSDRQHNNAIGGYVPIELKTNPTATHVTPRIVEIFAQNTCNFSCVYCAEDLSSQIQTENKKFGPNKNIKRVPIISNLQNTEYFDKFIDWLEENVQGLVRLHLLGGETYLQHDLMERIFDVIERRPNPNLQLNIFSNFNAPKKYWYDYNRRIKDYCASGNISRFDLTCSLDCWGPEAEYVRHGLDLTILEEYLAWAADQSEDWLYLNVNQTVSSMTIKTMPALIEKINEYSQHRHIGHYFMFVDGYKFQHPDIFDYSLWADDFDRIFATMRNNTAEDKETILRMVGLQKRLQDTCKQDSDNISKLHAYLDELDRRRNTNWRNLFPYLIVQ